MKTKHNSGFSLRELIFVIVVLVIVVLIAAPLFSALFFGHNCGDTIRIVNYGRNIVLSIISANIDRDASGMPDIMTDVRPKKETFLIGENPVDYTTGFSDDYFADLLENEIIENVDLSFFAEGGVPVAKNIKKFRAGGHNAWGYVGGITNATDDTIFLFTQNLRLTNEDLRHYANVKGYDKSFTYNRLDPSVKPYGDVLVAYVTRGGGVNKMKLKDFRYPANFFQSGIDFTSNPDAAVVHPKRVK